MRLPHRIGLIIPGLAAVSFLVAACGGGDSSTATNASSASSAEETLPDTAQVIIATSEVVTGPNRLLLAIVDGDRIPIGDVQAHLRFFLVQDGEGASPRAEAESLFVGKELATAQALHSTRATFDEPGAWEVEASITMNGQGPVISRTGFNVQAQNFAPKVGDPALPSQNMTLADAPIEQLTSQRPPGDPVFYALTIAQAMQQDKPFVVVFSNPAFCQTQTCGPQLEAAQALQQQFGALVNFIHVEVFLRPDLLLEREGQPQINPVILEWNLQSEPWVFVIDSQGNVFDRLEGFASRSELETSIRDVLEA